MKMERESAQPCGCDPGILDSIHGGPYKCQGHRDIAFRESQRHVQSDTFHDVARIPTQSTLRKTYPVASGVLDYFPLALLEISRVSHHGNEQHNPGQKLHWAREKSTDHADCLARHLLQRGTFDTDGMRHSAKVAWRALALLQLELETEGK